MIGPERSHYYEQWKERNLEHLDQAKKYTEQFKKSMLMRDYMQAVLAYKAHVGQEVARLEALEKELREGE